MNNKPKRNLGGLTRIVKETISNHKLLACGVLVSIFVSSIAGVIGNTFIKNLVDVYITPLLTETNPDYAPLALALMKLVGVYILGICATYAMSRLMIEIALGTLNSMRKKLFNHMETLPIKYFDTHAHGDIMSVYTNDIDTLRQLLSNSIPQFIQSTITIVAVLISMLIMNVYLALITVCFALFMLFVSKKITGVSGRYFRAQQMQLGKVNGFIEEMIEGTKVIKVFTHEEKTMEDFRKVNDELCDAATNANTFANILMPILGNLGYLSYVTIAIVGSIMAIHHVGGMTLGTIVAFVQLNRSFNGPINQISQQFNSIVMASAGAQRIYAVLDEASEIDDGKVTLVNIKEENG